MSMLICHVFWSWFGFHIFVVNLGGLVAFLPPYTHVLYSYVVCYTHVHCISSIWASGQVCHTLSSHCSVVRVCMYIVRVCMQVQEEVAGAGQPQLPLVPVGAATSHHARPVGPKHDHSPEQMQARYCTRTYSIQLCTYNVCVQTLGVIYSL